MSEEYILKVTERLYFKNKDGMQSKSFFTLHTHIYLGNIPLSWIDDRDFLDRLKELVRLRDSRDYIDIIPIAELTAEMQVKVRNNYEINSKDHNNAQYRVNAYINRRLRQTQPSTVDAAAEQTAPAPDSTAKPKRLKATKADIDNAINFLIYRYNKSKRKDWEQATINAELFDKFRRYFDLTKKSRLGRIWAILHHKSTGEPPKGWGYEDITKAINAIGKNYNLWDICRK